MTFVMGGVLTLAPGSDRIPVELLQILTQYAICWLPAGSEQKQFPYRRTWAFQVALVVKNPPANAGDAGSIPG